MINKRVTSNSANSSRDFSWVTPLCAQNILNLFLIPFLTDEKISRSKKILLLGLTDLKCDYKENEDFKDLVARLVDHANDSRNVERVKKSLRNDSRLN